MGVLLNYYRIRLGKWFLALQRQPKRLWRDYPEQCFGAMLCSVVVPPGVYFILREYPYYKRKRYHESYEVYRVDDPMVDYIRRPDNYPACRWDQDGRYQTVRDGAFYSEMTWYTYADM